MSAGDQCTNYAAYVEQTVYGVAAANLIFLPAAGKLRSRLKQGIRLRELMLDGVLSISEGLNQKLIRCKLEGYTRAATSEKKGPGVAKRVPGRS